MFDPQKKQHSIEYAQNFLKDPGLARYIVNLTSITPTDTVIEIGPGRGILTDAVLQKTPHLILLEKDTQLVQALQKKYAHIPSVTIIHTDALHYTPKTPEYILFSNPPFTHISQLIKQFIFAKNAPKQIYLFMQKEVSQRLQGQPFENQLSTIIKTWYEIQPLHTFARTDFSPEPSVDVECVAFYRNEEALISELDKQRYIQFVQYGFQQQKSDLMKNFERIFTYTQWKRLARELEFPLKAQPGQLTAQQWSRLFLFYTTGVAPEKKRSIETGTA